MTTPETAFAVLLSPEEQQVLLDTIDAGVKYLGARGLNLIVVGNICERIKNAPAVTATKKTPQPLKNKKEVEDVK